jgi:solute carrier family 10 (sodium/bile acid cotransporter), member 7
MALATLVRKYGFFFGLAAITLLILLDPTGKAAALGKVIKSHHGPDVAICLIFLLSGLLLPSDQIRAGLTERGGTFLALGLIFIVSPLTGYLLSLGPIDPGIKAGLILTAVMPATLSSGVVMTAAAGGNLAHALLLTLLSNTLSVFTIPFSLTLLLGLKGGMAAVPFDRSQMMLQIGSLVLAPLFLGLFLRRFSSFMPARLDRWVPIVNQTLVIIIVWMALSQARETMARERLDLLAVGLTSFLFHGFLLGFGFLSCRLLRMGPGRRESVIFMGGQKTLPLSLILQVTLFPGLGLALAFCVIHHVIHLMMDGYLVGRLARAKTLSPSRR